MRLMYDKHFSVRREQFVLTKEDEIFQLMTEGIQDLCRQFEVFYSKEYKANSIKKVGMLSAGTDSTQILICWKWMLTMGIFLRKS